MLLYRQQKYIPPKQVAVQGVNPFFIQLYVFPAAPGAIFGDKSSSLLSSPDPSRITDESQL